MTDLADFLLARIEEDEAVAPRRGGKTTAARRLAECEAKRRIVAEAQRLAALDLTRPRDGEFIGARNALGHVLRWLALPYSDHPDFDPSWSVGG